MKKTILTSYILALQSIIKKHPTDKNVVLAAGKLIALLDTAQTPSQAKKILEDNLHYGCSAPFTDINKWHSEISKLVTDSNTAKDSVNKAISMLQLQEQHAALKNLLNSTINHSECPLHVRYPGLVSLFPTPQTLYIGNLVSFFRQQLFPPNNTNSLTLNDIVEYIYQLPHSKLPENPKAGSFAAVKFINNDHKEVTQLLYNVTASVNEGCQKFQMANRLLQALLEIYNDLNVLTITETETVELDKSSIKC